MLQPALLQRDMDSFELEREVCLQHVGPASTPFYIVNSFLRLKPSCMCKAPWLCTQSAAVVLLKHAMHALCLQVLFSRW
jgi:hypothetical protein